MGSNRAQGFNLKFFSGPHAGAELLLDEGEYSIGSSTECDIVIQDSSVSPVHIRLRVSSRGVALVTAEQPLLCAGQMLNMVDSALPLQQLIGMGTSYFALAPHGEAWQVLQLPESLLPIVTQAEADTTAQAQITMPPSVPTSSGTLSYKLLSWGGIGVFLAGLLLLLMQNDPTKMQPMSTNANSLNSSPQQQVHDALTLLGLDHLQVVSTTNGRLRISGYVANTREKHQLAQALRKTDVPYQLQVRAPSELINASETLLATLQLPLQVSYDSNDKPGTLSLHGHTDDTERLQQAIELIKRDVPGVLSINSHVEINTSSASQPEPRIKLAIRSVSMNAIPFVVTGDGTKYMLGARLPNGYTIKAINETSLELRQGQETLIYHFAQP